MDSCAPPSLTMLVLLWMHHEVRYMQTAGYLTDGEGHVNVLLLVSLKVES